MAHPVGDTAGLFTDAVDHYIQHRAAYPPEVIGLLVERFGLANGGRVIDVGCGPGLLALPFALAGAEVLAIDPNAPMLDAGRVAADAKGLSVTFEARKAEDLTSADGPASLVTFGRSFHWTDRARVLSLLDDVVAPGGGIAILHEDGEQKAGTRVGAVISAVKRDWVSDGLDRHNRKQHEDHLRESVFSKTETIRATIPVRWTVEDVVGHMLSTSYCNPGRLGDRRAAFEADLRARLLAEDPSGVFDEELGFIALIGERP